VAWRRFRTWLAGLSEAGKVGVIAAGITTTGAIAAAVIGGLFQLMAAGAGSTANPSTSSVETTPAAITTTTAATTSAPAPSITTAATSAGMAGRRNVEHAVIPEGQRRTLFGGELAIAYRTNMLTDDKGWVLYGYVTETATGASLELQQLAVGDQIRFGKKRHYLVTLLCVSPNCEGLSLAAEFEVRRQ
jgi:hypothetical protein